MASKQDSESKRILIVEDDASYRALLQSILRKAGYQSTACINGDQAMDKLKKETFDLMVVDFLLPGPNAIEVIQWARKQHINIPALLITAYPSDHLLTQCQSLKGVKFIVKADFDPSTLPSLISEYS